MLDFHIFTNRNICQKFTNCRLLNTYTFTRKIWWRSDDPRPSYMRIFDFQNGDRPPVWIWYDFISDNLWLVSKIAPCSCLYFARYRDFYIRPFGLKLPIHATFGGYCIQMNSDIVATHTYKPMKPLRKNYFHRDRLGWL